MVRTTPSSALGTLVYPSRRNKANSRHSTLAIPNHADPSIRKGCGYYPAPLGRWGKEPRAVGRHLEGTQGSLQGAQVLPQPSPYLREVWISAKLVSKQFTPFFSRHSTARYFGPQGIVQLRLKLLAINIVSRWCHRHPFSFDSGPKPPPFFPRHSPLPMTNKILTSRTIGMHFFPAPQDDCRGARGPPGFNRRYCNIAARGRQTRSPHSSAAGAFSWIQAWSPRPRPRPNFPCPFPSHLSFSPFLPSLLPFAGYQTRFSHGLANFRR
jgi:hypothetical protein